MSIAALYLHVPFCRARCAYCDFETRAYPACDLEGAISAYLDRLERRIEHFGRQGALEGVETVYIGGGTPSLLGGRLVDLAAGCSRIALPWNSRARRIPSLSTLHLHTALPAPG